MISNYEELKNELACGKVTRELMECVKLSTGPDGHKLRLKERFARDDIPQDFDIDQEIYTLQRQQSDSPPDEAQSVSKGSRKRVVAEGDSWFNLPPFIRPLAIADRLKDNGKYKVSNIARWGHTLASIARVKEHLEEIDNYDADFLMLSAGGNDLQNRLEKDASQILHRYDPGRDVNDYLTRDGLDLIEVEIGELYNTLLKDVVASFPDLPVLCHAYDYPRPLNMGGKGQGGRNHGKYIGQFLDEMDIPDNKMVPIMNPIMDRMNDVIASVADSYPQVSFIDCRNVTKRFNEWRDDMHPKKKGFIALTDVFQNKLDSL